MSSLTESPTQNPFNRTLSPARRDELDKIRQRQLSNAVHYIWETGEDKFAFRYFHTGFWESCEKQNGGEIIKACCLVPFGCVAFQNHIC